MHSDFGINWRDGSPHPGDVLTRLGYYFLERLKVGVKSLEYPIRIEDASLSGGGESQQQFSRIVTDPLDRLLPDKMSVDPERINVERGSLILRLNNGVPDASILMETGEQVHGERLLLEYSIDDQTASLERLGDSTCCNAKLTRILPIAGFGGVAAITEVVPLVAELALLGGVAYTFLAERRIRFGVKFEGGASLVGDVREAGWRFLSAIWRAKKAATHTTTEDAVTARG